MARRVELGGRSVLISGASSGIGAATAVACARVGMRVAIMARRADKLDEVAGRIRGEGGEAHPIVGSVDSDGDCAGAIEESERALGALYGVVANAGYGQEAACVDMGEDAIRAMFETNFYGSLRLARPAIARFRARGAGHAVLVSSCLSKMGMPYYGCYSATKAAQDHFARAMRHELAGTGVDVSSVHPIGTQTAFFETAAARSGGALEFAGSGARFMQPASRVADAIVRRLRRPGGEVWTSAVVRLGLAAGVALPGAADAVLRRRVEARRGGRV